MVGATCRGLKGPFRFGGLTMAHAMNGPVCTRFATRVVEREPACALYTRALCGGRDGAWIATPRQTWRRRTWSSRAGASHERAHQPPSPQITHAPHDLRAGVGFCGSLL